MTITQKQRRILILGIVLLPFVSCAGFVVYNRVWWAHAEAAIHETVSSAALGQSPNGIVTSIDTAALRTDFALSYEIVGADNFLGGTSLADLISPGVYVATLRFANRHEYEVEARRGPNGVWEVAISAKP